MVSIVATYRQFNRIPLDNERLVSAGKLRNQDIDLAGFVASVAMSKLFRTVCRRWLF